MDDGIGDAPHGDRPHWMSLLARAELRLLEDVWQSVHPKPAHQVLRAPEVGLVMLRGRMGGVGTAFNVGEATVTRCTVSLKGGHVGHAYVLGRSLRHAELAAIFDALLQRLEPDLDLRGRLIEPIERHLAAQRSANAQRREATRVEFFTMVRGDD